MLRELYHSYRSTVKHLKWRLQAKKITHLTHVSNAVPFTCDGPILIIAPHADDELIGCHRLIRNNAEKITILYCAFLGSNYSEQNRQVRQREFEHYARMQGCDYAISSPEQLQSKLITLIHQLNPAYIFLPSFVDWHPEHRLINKILIETFKAITMNVRIGWYHISLPIPGIFVNSYSEMDEKQQHEKWETMAACYPSQMHMDISRFKFIENLGNSSATLAEAYVILPISKWKTAVETVSDETELNSLKMTLGNIKSMYIETTNVYKQILL